MIGRWVTLAGFQVCWFACVLGAAWGYPWTGVIVSLAWLSVQIYRSGEGWRSEILLLVLAGVLGYVADSLVLMTGYVEFPDQAALGGPSPLWMVALWMNLAATLRPTAPWLLGRYGLGALLGALAPLTYWSGSRLGALVFLREEAAAVIALEWVIGMPALLGLERLTSRRTGTGQKGTGKAL